MSFPLTKPCQTWQKPLRQTQDSVPPIATRADRHQVPLKDLDYFFTLQVPNSLVLKAATECSHQFHSKATPKDKGLKRLHIHGRKVYSTATLQMHSCPNIVLFFFQQEPSLQRICHTNIGNSLWLLFSRGTSQQKHQSRQLLMELIQPHDPWLLPLPWDVSLGSRCLEFWRSSRIQSRTCCLRGLSCSLKGLLMLCIL